MSKGRRKPKGSSRDHFSPDIRRKACLSLNSVLASSPGVKKQIRDGHWKLYCGRGRNGPVSLAWGLFLQELFNTDLDRERVANMKKSQFRRILYDWAPGWFSGTNVLCEEHKQRQNQLSAADAKQLAAFLKQPRLDSHGTHFWRTLDEALQGHPQRVDIARLVARWPHGHASLEKHLLSVDPDLRFGIVDQRDKLPTKTLNKRRRVAKILRGEQPWLWKGEHGLAQVLGPAQKVPEFATFIHWEQHYFIYTCFTFMYDAFTLTDEDGAKLTKQKGFFSASELYPPEEVRASKPGTSALKAMTYIGINGVLGRVTPITLTYTGSTHTRSKKAINADLRAGIEFPDLHEPWFPHWCAPALIHCSQNCCAVTEHVNSECCAGGEMASGPRTSGGKSSRG